MIFCGWDHHSSLIDNEGRVATRPLTHLTSWMSPPADRRAFTSIAIATGDDSVATGTASSFARLLCREELLNFSLGVAKKKNS